MENDKSLQITTPELLFFNSRFTQMSDGSGKEQEAVKPTSGQKWWASVLLGFVFAIISSPSLYGLTNMSSNALGGPKTNQKSGATLFGLILHTIIFILIVRIILW